MQEQVQARLEGSTSKARAVAAATRRVWGGGGGKGGPGEQRASRAPGLGVHNTLGGSRWARPYLLFSTTKMQGSL